MKTTTVGELAALVGGDIRGDCETVISGGQSLEKAGPQDITFAENEKNLRKLSQCNAACVLLKPTDNFALQPDWKPPSYLLVDNPMQAFMQSLFVLRPPRPRLECGISPDAFVSPTATIGSGTNIHPRAHLYDDVEIGERCDIFPGVVIGPGCRLGDDVVLHPNVVLYHDVIIGNRVIIHASAVIGADGFGYRLVDGRHERIPHFGTTRIADDVEIGACTTVDRAMIGETVVGEGTKLDNQVMIAHNCELGRHNVIVAQVGFAGSVTTGDYVVCAGHAGIADHVHLGERSVIGSKAGVPQNVPPGETYIGIPARPAKESFRIWMSGKKLPEALKTMRALEKDVARLKSLLDSQNDSNRNEAKQNEAKQNEDRPAA